MQSKEEVQKEYDALYQEKPNHWGNYDRSNFMISLLEAYIPNPKEVVDIGCGNGITLENYRRHNKTVKLYGIDLSEEGIRLAQLRIPDGIFTTEDEFEDIKKFDLVLCLGVAEHVEDLSNFLKSLKNKINKDGFCYFEVPNNLHYSKGPQTFRRLTIGSKQIEWHFPRIVWEQELLKAGFKIIKQYKGLQHSWEFIWILK